MWSGIESFFFRRADWFFFPRPIFCDKKHRRTVYSLLWKRASKKERQEKEKEEKEDSAFPWSNWETDEINPRKGQQLYNLFQRIWRIAKLFLKEIY